MYPFIPTDEYPGNIVPGAGVTVHVPGALAGNAGLGRRRRRVRPEEIAGRGRRRPHQQQRPEGGLAGGRTRGADPERAGHQERRRRRNRW